LPKASGQRHLVSTTNTPITIKFIAEILNEELSPKGYKISTESLNDEDGKRTVNYIDNSRMVNVLGVSPIDLKKTLIDTVYSFIEHGIFKPEINRKKKKTFSFTYFNLNRKHSSESNNLIEDETIPDRYNKETFNLLN
jgi:hypothetical protein